MFVSVWDNIQLSNYNFSWWDVTSFLPYTDETSVAENSMLLRNSGALTIASMKSVLLSLTQNARGIYMIVVENQLAANKATNYQGEFIRKYFFFAFLKWKTIFFEHLQDCHSRICTKNVSKISWWAQTSCFGHNWLNFVITICWNWNELRTGRNS